jgi:hypothetical protein
MRSAPNQQRNVFNADIEPIEQFLCLLVGIKIDVRGWPLRPRNSRSRKVPAQ